MQTVEFGPYEDKVVLLVARSPSLGTGPGRYISLSDLKVKGTINVSRTSTLRVNLGAGQRIHMAGPFHEEQVWRCSHLG